MSDNIRPFYDAEYDAPAGVAGHMPGHPGPYRRCHCESGDIIVRDTCVPDDLKFSRRPAGSRATGAYQLFDVRAGGNLTRLKPWSPSGTARPG